MKLPNNIDQKGVSKLSLILVGSFILAFLVFGSVVKNYTTKLEPTSSTDQTSNLPSPTFAYLLYKSTNPVFSVSYPNTYRVEKDLFGYKRIKAIYATSFVPYDKTKLESDSIFLTVFDRAGGVSLSNWVGSNTTPYKKDDAKLGGKTYAYYNVTDKKVVKVGDKDGQEFTVNYPESNTKLIYTVLASPKYIFLLSYTPGTVVDVYQKMLTSLEF